MKKICALFIVLTLIIAPVTQAYARGSSGHYSGHSGSSHSSSHGKASSSVTKVSGYTKKNGTQIKPHYRTTADGTVKNNYDYKGNYNPYTGKTGTKSYDPTYKSYSK